MVTALAVITGVFVTLAAFLILVWIFQERIAFQPPRPSIAESTKAECIAYEAEDGQQLLAYIVGDVSNSRGLILCFHGNADLAIHAIGWGEHVVVRTGFAVMLAEYRGYMGLGGHPTYLNSQLDAEAAFVHARDSLHVSPEYIAFYGHSLGSAVAAELASRHCPLVLILESPFTSARAMGRIIGWHPVQIAWSVISRFHFDTIARVASVDAPVWIAHGAEDRLIPPEMGKDVFAAARKKGEMLIVPTASHNDVVAEGGEEYWRWLSLALKP